MTYSFQLDPCEILGISVSASLHEIREAYRSKTKKHHPDVGGDEWAFRVLTRSYEILSTARVAGRVSEERSRAEPRPATTARAAENVAESPFGPATPPPGGDPARDRRGVRDKVEDPARLVEVEMILIRFEVDNPLTMFLESPEDRSLSCTLNVGWPIPELAARADTLPGAARAHAVLAEAFEAVTSRSPIVSARSSVEQGRFVGWLSFTTVARAEDAFRQLRAALAEHGFGVEQWVREMAIPRTWRE